MDIMGYGELMPIYEYQCEECGEEFEKLIRSVSSPPEIECPKCGSDKIRKILSAFGIKMGSENTCSSGVCNLK